MARKAINTIKDRIAGMQWQDPAAAAAVGLSELPERQSGYAC